MQRRLCSALRRVLCCTEFESHRHLPGSGLQFHRENLRMMSLIDMFSAALSPEGYWQGLNLWSWGWVVVVVGGYPLCYTVHTSLVLH